MMFRRLFQAVDHPPRQHREVAGVDRQAHGRERRQRPVEQEIAGAQQPSFLPLDPLRVDHIEPLPLFVEQHRDRLRRVLQVAVHHHHEVARHVIQRRGDGNLVAEVARQRDRDDARIVPRPPRASISNVRSALPSSTNTSSCGPPGMSFSTRRRRASSSGQHLLLVEHRDRDRQARRRRHDRGRPLKYTMCHNGIPNPVR